eukprot:11409804-Heterocapsa_arctica.AAC.1
MSNKRANTSGTARVDDNTYSLLVTLNKREAAAQVPTQAPLHKKSKARVTTDSSSNQAVGSIVHLFQTQIASRAIDRGPRQDAVRPGPIDT